MDPIIEKILQKVVEEVDAGKFDAPVSPEPFDRKKHNTKEKRIAHQHRLREYQSVVTKIIDNIQNRMRNLLKDEYYRGSPLIDYTLNKERTWREFLYYIVDEYRKMLSFNLSSIIGKKVAAIKSSDSKKDIIHESVYILFDDEKTLLKIEQDKDDECCNWRYLSGIHTVQDSKEWHRIFTSFIDANCDFYKVT